MANKLLQKATFSSMGAPSLLQFLSYFATFFFFLTLKFLFNASFVALSLKKKIVLEYIHLTMLRQFQVNREGTQPYTQVSILPQTPLPSRLLLATLIPSSLKAHCHLNPQLPGFLKRNLLLRDNSPLWQYHLIEEKDTFLRSTPANMNSSPLSTRRCEYHNI